MTVEAYTKGLFRGLSTDPKPVDTLAGNEFLETDTKKTFRWNGTIWMEFYESFPISSVFLTLNQTDPGSMIGYGTWEEIAFPGQTIHAWQRIT